MRRIDGMWTDCRNRFGAGGPFLFGSFGAADAMYAAVVSRFHTYAVEVSRPPGPIWTPSWRCRPGHEWRAAALKEPWVLAEDEVDWPTVLRV